MITYFEKTLSTIQKSLASLDEKQFIKLLDDCYNSILRGNKVIVSGLGKNVPIGEKFVGTLNSYGINAAFLHTNTAIHGDLGIIKKGDTLILLSKSGNTEETIALYTYVIDRQINIWGITFSKDSELIRRCKNGTANGIDDETNIGITNEIANKTAKGSTIETANETVKGTVNGIALDLDSEGDKWDIVPNNSTTIYLVLLQGLAIQLADRLGVTLFDFKRNHPGGSIGRTLGVMERKIG